MTETIELDGGGRGMAMGVQVPALYCFLAAVMIPYFTSDRIIKDWYMRFKRSPNAFFTLDWE